jgi:hypothetical protein
MRCDVATKMKRWTVGLVLCFLLVASSKARAAYVVVENISQNAPSWGDCGCIPATGWLTGVFMGLDVQDADGTSYTLVVVPADYYPRNVTMPAGNFYLLDITKKNPVDPGSAYTSKKIVGLPDSGFTFRPGGATAGFRYCAVETVGCGGYSTSGTNVVNQIFIMPGVDGSDSFEFQVPGPNGVVDSVVRVTFYPGNPPRNKNK